MWRRLGFSLAGLAAVLSVGVGGVRVYVTRPSFLNDLRARAEQALQARVEGATLGPHVSVGFWGQVELGPVELLDADPAALPVVRIETVAVSPSLGALLRGTVQPSALTLRGVRVRARPALELPARLKPKSSGKHASGEPKSLHVEVRDLVIEHLPGQTLGPLDVSLDAHGATVSAEVAFPEGGRLRVDGAPRSGATTLVLEDLALPSLVVAFMPAGVTLTQGRLGGTATVRPGEGDRLEVDVSLVASALAFQGDRLATTPVGPLTFKSEGLVSVSPSQRQLQLDSMKVSLGDTDSVALRLSGDASLGLKPSFRARLSAQDVPLGKLMAALPEALRPPSPVLGCEGPLSGWAELSGQLGARRDWKLDGKLDLKPLAAALRAQGCLPQRGAFVHSVTLLDGSARALNISSSNPAFVSLDEVPQTLVKAVLLSEDAGFFGHQGFDFAELATHLATGGRDARGVIRGGSTLTQQLAKNLFLTREKTYARKVREAFTTLALEVSLPKARMLEIYLNIIEWGPGLYGIGEAAWHYFGKRPRDLSVREVAFLVTIIPNPVKYHGYCSRGAVTEVWDSRMADLLRKMNNTGVISWLELEIALRQGLDFAHGRSL